jgi:type VI secretion system protein ImpA
MGTATIISDGILAPISPDKPAGEDLGVTADWVRIRNARPNVYDTGSRGEWQPAMETSASWERLADEAAQALETKSKDLRLAIWLLEASVKLHGFAGVRDGVSVVRGLLVEYWDTGLFPPIEEGDLETRSGPLEWLNGPLAEVIREIPITLRTAPGENYSVNFYHECRRPEGRITAQEFDSAADAGSRRQYEDAKIQFEEAWQAFQEFEQVSEQKFGALAPSLNEAKEAFEECRMVFDSILRRKRIAEPDPVSGTGDGTEPGQEQGAGIRFIGTDSADSALGASWREAEQLVQSGQIDAGLVQMTKLSGAEPNGRVRFQRKLLLADVCLNTRRVRLAKSILEELAELIDKHQLENWETSQMIGAVWTRLHRCYKNEEAGTANEDKASQLFNRLCRLDPWQAMSCGEGK